MMNNNLFTPGLDLATCSFIALISLMSDKDIDAIICSLLNLDVSARTRAELYEFKRQLDAGLLQKDDCRYIKALYRRLAMATANVSGNDTNIEVEWPVSSSKSDTSAANGNDLVIVALCFLG